MKKYSKIMLMQPNYSILGKRSWSMAPYGLAILNSCIKSKYDVYMYDPNFEDITEEKIRKHIYDIKPDIIGITSFSSEYKKEIDYYSALIKEVLPDALVIVGGALPTVMIDKMIDNSNIDYFVMGEGEYRLLELLDALNDSNSQLHKIDGIAFKNKDATVINHPTYFIENLDNISFPDYGNLDFSAYGNYKLKYANGLIPRQYPFATTITSRGCPFKCTFCAAKTVSGTKVRMRSAENILSEIDMLCLNHSIKEVIFLDDHFLFSRKRAVDIMQGIIERDYGITWKCANVAVFSLTDQILDLMRKSGSYQLTLSIESGDQFVLKNLIKKPVDLKMAEEVVRQAKSMGFEVISNFVFGFPGETWEQIRRTIAYAESLDLDIVNFHIATPLPKTELMEICIKEGLLESEDDITGYTHGVIATSEFSKIELQILRSFEWDRINFKNQRDIENIARLEGITVDEVEDWRKRTRRGLGSTVNWPGNKLDGKKLHK